MTTDEFVPVGFDPPTSLATGQFRLEPLGPQHNRRTLARHRLAMAACGPLRSLKPARTQIRQRVNRPQGLRLLRLPRAPG
jgi:hypothetical protein